MKSNWKKICALVIMACLGLTILAGCGGQQAEPTAASQETTAAQTGETTEGTKIDLSAHAALKMYLLGDKPVDSEVVWAELNKLIERDLNASLKIDFISWSDYEQKYPLVLSSGEEIDLIYTSDWAFYVQEATKGAFMEVTDEIIKNYMPLTDKIQDKASLDQARINGKIYFVPKNTTGFTNEDLIGIRGDLREKYGIPPLKNVDDLEKYFYAVAENEKDIYPYAAATYLGSLKSVIFYQDLNWVAVYRGKDTFGYSYDPNTEFSVEQIQYSYFTPEYADFAKKMREWAKAGFWSKNAISGKTGTADTFKNGTSASHAWNPWSVAGPVKDITKKNPEWKPEIYDLNPGVKRQLDFFTGDGMAVPYTSKYPERAFMLLDKLKNDEIYYKTFVFGIEGKHWIAQDGGLWKQGPDFDKFPNNAACQWGVNNDFFKSFQNISEDKEILQMVNGIEDVWRNQVVHPITEAFRFDDSKVANEMATMATLEQNYGNLLDLGMVEDIDKTLAEFKDKAQKAGFDSIMAEMKSQMEAFLKTAKQ